MSGVATQYVWELDIELSASCKFVLFALAHRANIKDDEPGVYKCWPSTACIAKDTGLSVKTVQRSLKNLINKGLITKQVRTENNLKIASIYRLPGVPAFAKNLSRKDKVSSIGHSDLSIGHGGSFRSDSVTHKQENNKNKNIYPKPQPSWPRNSYPLAFENLCGIYPNFKNLRMSKSKAFELYDKLSGDDKNLLLKAVHSYTRHLSKNKWKTARHFENFLKDSYWKTFVDDNKTITEPQRPPARVQAGGIAPVRKELQRVSVLDCEARKGKKELTQAEAVEICVASGSQIVINAVNNDWHSQLLDFVQKMHRMPFPDEVESVMANAKKINQAMDTEDQYTSPVLRKNYQVIRDRRARVGQELISRMSA